LALLSDLWYIMGIFKCVYVLAPAKVIFANPFV